MRIVGAFEDDDPTRVRVTVIRDPEHIHQATGQPTDALILMLEFEGRRTSTWNIDVASGGIAGGMAMSDEAWNELFDQSPEDE